MALGLDGDGRLFAVLLPPDHRLGQVHGDGARVVGLAQSEDGPARLDVVQGRNYPDEGR